MTDSSEHDTIMPRQEEAHATTLTNDTNDGHVAHVCSFCCVHDTCIHATQICVDAMTMMRDTGARRIGISFPTILPRLIQDAGLLFTTRARALDQCFFFLPPIFFFLFLTNAKAQARLPLIWGPEKKKDQSENVQ